MGTLRKNYNAAVEMYNQGLSVRVVGKAFSQTPQCMYRILKRRGVKFRPKITRGESSPLYRGGATARRAFIVTYAVEKGILTPKPCEVCGLPPKLIEARGGRKIQRIHAHHDDYNFPLRVRWLCPKHHLEWHAHNRPIPQDLSIPKPPRKNSLEHIQKVAAANRGKKRTEEARRNISASKIGKKWTPERKAKYGKKDRKIEGT